MNKELIDSVEEDGIGMGLWSIVAKVEGLQVGQHLVFGGWGMQLGAVQWLGQLTAVRGRGTGMLRPWVQLGVGDFAGHCSETTARDYLVMGVGMSVLRA